MIAEQALASGFGAELLSQKGQQETCQLRNAERELRSVKSAIIQFPAFSAVPAFPSPQISHAICIHTLIAG
jgi:hypothetical protein